MPRSVYLDHSATTPLDPRAAEAMQPYLTEQFGNASSAHRAGRDAERAVEDAREAIARVLHCKPSEILFTSGGTESNNAAIRGAAWARRAQGNHLITTPVEHSAVSKTVEQLASVMGFQATFLPVDHDGRVDAETLGDAITAETTVASIMYANNEVGTIQPIPQLAAMARERGVWFHTDAVQAAGQLSLDVNRLGMDMMSLSAHKFYGPKGVGALYVREGIALVPQQTGGSHEQGRRAGTLNTPGIVGMAAALTVAEGEREARTARYRHLRQALIDGILARVPGAMLTGHPQERLPSHTSFVFDGIDGNMLIIHLDLKGIQASSASACKTGNPEPSGVLLAMGFDAGLAGSSLRLSVGKDTSDSDIEYTIETLAATVGKLRRLRATMLN